MSLPHFFAGAPEPGESVVLEAGDARHAIRSLRLRPGDRFTSSDGRGGLAQCRIVRAAQLLVEGEVVERDVAPSPRPDVSVLLAPPRGERLSWAVQKLTEVGTDGIVLIEAPRSVRRWSGERASRAAGRMEAVAREAAKQSRRRFLPRVMGPIPWAEAVPAPDGRTMILWEGASHRLSTLLPLDAPEAVALVIGPEGGISEEDAREAERSGALLASLGPQILRTETAAIVAATMTLARYGRLA
ncbi:MAG: RsmE family RNA methyltransferase [Actinomycetota bacterium]